MAQFIKQGSQYYRQDDTGALYPVTDKDTLSGLDSGHLPYNSIGASRALSFGGSNPAPSPSTGAPQTQDIGALVKEKLIGALTAYKGVTDTTQLEMKRQELLRKQLLTAPYSAEGESSLTGAQKLTLLRDRGNQLDPEIRSLEEQITKAKSGDSESAAALAKLVSLAKETGVIQGERKTSITEANGRRLLVDSDTGETIKDLGSTKNSSGDGSDLSASQLAKVTAIAQSHDTNQIVKDYNTIQNKSGSMQKILDSGVGGPGDLALVFEFMKALDPTSVVRETEYDTASKSGNIFAGQFAKFNGYLKPEGGILPPSVQKAFISIMKSKLDVATKQYENYHGEQARKINKITGLEDGEEYLTNYAGVSFEEKKPATISKGSMSNKQFIDAVLNSKGLDYNKVVGEADRGNIMVIDNDSGQIGEIPVGEFDSSKYTRL